ncbi:hypothetical protein [Acinetobacter sp. ANC 4805]|uniref:hypothetical protein n=1 Tax=Acinetobacter sp. ANC 4805 TaxID=2923425 RepID=UPI001F4A4C3C|nr:hypothetical protein [Acinetobacter sp. ANC 4805]MCH7310611.1 hypothetical protein [Acinetobacter sp. ANC 4805]
MKNLVLLCAVTLLVGCKEDQTGMEKNILNYAYNNCLNNFNKNSPAAIHINNSYIGIYDSNAADIYKYSYLLNEKNKVSNIQKDAKSRYRELGVTIKYNIKSNPNKSEIKNYKCTYFYELIVNSESPESINLIRIVNDGQNIKIKDKSDKIEDYSNLNLNNGINSIISFKSQNQFNSKDQEMYNKVEAEADRIQNIKKQKEAEQIAEDKKTPLIPRSMTGDKGKYYLIEKSRIGDIVTTLHKRVGVDSTGYTKLNINCKTEQAQELGYSEKSAKDIKLNPSSWYNLEYGSSKYDLYNFVCN